MKRVCPILRLKNRKSKNILNFGVHVNFATTLNDYTVSFFDSVKKNAEKSKFSKIGSVRTSIFIKSTQKLKKNRFGVPSGSGNLPKCDF